MPGRNDAVKFVAGLSGIELLQLQRNWSEPGAESVVASFGIKGHELQSIIGSEATRRGLPTDPTDSRNVGMKTGRLARFRIRGPRRAGGG